MILFVIFEDELRKILMDAFHEYGCPFSYKIAPTIEEAQKVLSQNTIHAIVMTKTEALSGDDGMNGLIKTQLELPPTVTIIQQGDFLYYLYAPYKNNDWVTMPFDLQELYGRISSVIRKANK